MLKEFVGFVDAGLMILASFIEKVVCAAAVAVIHEVN
jgi:hypothetical protein